MFLNAFDNRENNLIVHIDDELIHQAKNKVYRVKDFMGKGAFGQVFLVENEKSAFAAKVIKSSENYAEYTLQVEYRALVHINKYERLLKKGQATIPGISDTSFSRIVKLRDQFEYKDHMVLIFEKLDLSLYDLLRIVKFEGFTMNMIKKFGRYLLEGVLLLHSKQIVHCDLKPENIMLIDRESYKLKIIDLGSSCFHNNFAAQYLQSRYYRAPEVILELPLSEAIDIWSVGCILLEFYLGIPIFPGIGVYDMLFKMSQVLG